MGAVSRLVLLAAALFVFAGCTGDSAAPTTSSTTSSTSTTQPTTSSTTMTSSTTTTSTTDPLSDVEAEVEAAYFRSYEVYISCLRTLPECVPALAFAEVFTGETYDLLVNTVSQSKAEGSIYEAPEHPGHARTEILNISVNDDLTEAVVSFCTLAGDTKLLIGPDGSKDRVGLNNTILVEWGDAEMVFGNDGIWRVADYPADVGDVVEVPFDEIDRQLEGGLLCDGETLDN